MRQALAIVIAVVSALLGASVVASRRPWVRWPLLLGAVALGALVAEGISVWWVGAPTTPLVPAVDGLLLGLVVSWLSGRRRPPRSGSGPKA
jgi:hypothetical protein